MLAAPPSWQWFLRWDGHGVAGGAPKIDRRPRRDGVSKFYGEFFTHIFDPAPLRAKASDQVKDPHQGRIGHLSDRGKPSKGRTDRTSDPEGAINSGSLELAEEFPPL
jgi:hypothetical protein